jgi:hypothetical protein
LGGVAFGRDEASLEAATQGQGLVLNASLLQVVEMVACNPVMRWACSIGAKQWPGKQAIWFLAAL